MSTSTSPSPSKGNIFASFLATTPQASTALQADCAKASSSPQTSIFADAVRPKGTCTSSDAVPSWPKSMVFTGHASGSCSSTPASSEDSGTSGTNGSSETEACDDGDAKEVATTRHLPRGEGPGLSSSAPEPACRAPTAPLAHRHAHEALGEVPETQKPVQQAQQRDGPAASANPGLGTSPRPKKDQEERLQAHLKLLQQHDDLAELHEVQTTPIFTEPVREHAVSAVSGRQSQPFTQFGLLAGDISTPETAAADPRVFYNVAAPSSVFICGSQGSGKSHSLSCLLENCLLQTAANELPRPLTGLLFHYDSFISDTGGSPCEAAWLSTHRNVSVRVLCPPSNIATMQKLYRRFPRITVEELRLSQADLNTKRMLDLMAVSHSNTMPLYLHVVNRVLRDLRTSQQRSGSTFDYTMFKQLLMAEKLSPDQKNPLQQRLETLESFMLVSEAKAFDMFTQGQQVKQVKQVQQATRANQRATDWTPRPGQLTILDLSCPTVTAETACSLFHICLSLFLEQKSSVGRVIALDEAHKYMTGSDDSKGLTESLLTIIRMQRHLGARVFISTQEPTINPKLIDLCSISLVHRFTSPDWLNTLRKHLAGGSSTSRLLERAAKVGGAAREEATQVGEYRGLQGLAVHSEEVALELFAKIVNLRVGEALLFAPSGIIGLQEAQQACSSPSFRRLADGVLKVRIRHRTTGDGGRSIMAD